MTGEGFEPRGRDRGDRKPRRACRPLWLGGLPEPVDPPPDEEDHDPATCAECAGDLHELDGVLGEVPPEPDLGEIVVILLAATLAGLRDRLSRDGFDSAAALVHDLVEVADDYVTGLQP